MFILYCFYFHYHQQANTPSRDTAAGTTAVTPPAGTDTIAGTQQQGQHHQAANTPSRDNRHNTKQGQHHPQHPTNTPFI